MTCYPYTSDALARIGIVQKPITWDGSFNNGWGYAVVWTNRANPKEWDDPYVVKEVHGVYKGETTKTIPKNWFMV